MKPTFIYHSPAHLRHQHGMTLVEVMIAITISLILLAGVMQIFTSSRQTYRVQDNMARLQENGRFAINFLTRDLRMAGYTGCASKSTTVTNIVAPPLDTAASFTGGGITGYEYTALPIALSATDTLTTSNVRPGTDIIIIKGAAPSGATLSGNMTAVNANVQFLTASVASMFVAGEILFISDCGSADIFAATNVSSGAGTTTIAHSSAANTTVNLSKPYNTDAEIMRMENYTYYIGTDAANNNAPTLYRKRLVGAAMITEPLVEGVENMQILYGEDTDTDGAANKYVAADTAGLNMNRIVSVRMNLLLRTAEDNLANPPQVYSFNGAPVTAADHRLRRVFSTTIKVRNKGL